MRKILSLALALCMVFSLSTVAFADDGYSTKVRFEGSLESYWELDVPTSMLPGETKEVKLEGTWDTTTIYNVRADEVVTMGNDIDTSVKELSIDFTPISQVGDVTNTITVTRDISVESMGGDYFGNWEGVFNYYLTVDKAEVSSELEVDENGNYLVSDAADLFTLSRLVNSGENNFDNKTILMTDDIDLKNVPFTPIGHPVDGVGDASWDTSVAFMGTFDGQGNTIYNLRITAEDYETNRNSAAGLFGGVVGGTIKKLNVDGATISGTHFAGVIAGSVTTSRYAYIEDCNVINATVVSTYYNDDNSGDKAGVIAGTVGQNYIKNCTATDCTVTASRDAGQIVGAAGSAHIEGCSATNVEVKWNGLGTGSNIRNEIIGRVF